jgi:hypothetical protein
MKDLEKTTLLERVDSLSEKEQELVSNFIDNLTKKTNLLPVFEEKLKSIKNNPVEEPKLAKAQLEIAEKMKNNEIESTEALLEIVGAIYTDEEIEAIELEYNFELKDVVKFGGAVSDKVFGYKEIVDGVEVFKEIESQMNLKPIPYSKKREIREQQKKYSDAIGKLVGYLNETEKNFEEIDEVKLKDLQENAEKEEKIFSGKISSAHNLDTSSMSDWEKELLKQKVVANSFGNYMPPMGKK